MKNMKLEIIMNLLNIGVHFYLFMMLISANLF